MTNDMLEIDGYKVAKQYEYMETHEWVFDQGDGTYKIGISDYAVKMLKELTYVEFPDVGEIFSKGDVVIVVESLKASGDVYAPFDLEIVEVNEILEDEPQKMNEDPYGEGFLAVVKPTGSVEGLLTAEEYIEKLKEYLAEE